MNTIHFDPLTAGAHARDVHELLTGYAKRGKLALADDTADRPLSEYLIHAAACQFGLVIEISVAAIE